MGTLDNLRHAAKRWLKALRAGDTAASTRLFRVHPRAPAQPGLRDVQHALARERGFDSWIALLQAHASGDLQAHTTLVRDLLAAYESGEGVALDRLRRRYGTSFTPDELRAGIERRLVAVPDAERPAGAFALPHARLLVAREYGFDTWVALETSINSSDAQAGPTPADAALRNFPDLTERMIQPVEMRSVLPVRLHGGVMTSTADVWQMLTACRTGHIERVREMLAACPPLALCDYNYLTPLHLAVREGHLELVRYLVERGAANPNYVTYPYRETLLTVASDRGYGAIAQVVEDGYRTADRARPEDEGGEILYDADDLQRRFQKLLNTDAPAEIERLLRQRPALAQNPFAFWSEGVLMMPAKLGHRAVIEVLMRYGARVPEVSKWGAWYYLWHDDIAALLLDLGMDPNHTNCHHTTVLHDMAYTGDTRKAALLLEHGADVNAIDEEFRSTPLGLAARWGHREMVSLLLERGADPSLSGSAWATPLAWARHKGHADVAGVLQRAGAGG